MRLAIGTLATDANLDRRYSLSVRLARRDEVAPASPGSQKRQARSKKRAAAVPPKAQCASGTLTRSDGANEGGPKETAAMRSIGLDLGTSKIALCEVAGGKVIRRATVASMKELEPFLGPGSGLARVAFEASRSAWAVHAELCGWGHDVKMIDTTRVKQIGIGQHGKKNDSIDAECIAMAVEQGRIPEAHVLSVERQRLRHLMMTRRALVESRTTMVTTIRGIATSEGIRLPRCEPENFVSMLKRQDLPKILATMVMPLGEVLITTEKQLCELDGRVQQACAGDKAAQCMMSVPGVGPVVAAMFLSVIDDAKRFRSARQVTSYLGLVPRETSSGTTGQRLGSITNGAPIPRWEPACCSPLPMPLLPGSRGFRFRLSV